VHRKSLRVRLVLLVLIPSIPLLAITAYVASELRNRDVANARAELTAFASLAATDLQDASQETRNLLEAVARIPAVTGAAAQECTRILSAMVESAPRFGVMLMTDAEGRATCHSAGPSSLAYYGDRTYFGNLRRSGDFFSGEPVIGRVTGKPLFITALAVRGDSGEFIGALMTGIDLRWFGDNLVRRMPYPGLSLTMWSADGTILYRHPEPERWIGRKAQETGIAQAVVSRGTGSDVVEASDVRGVPSLYAIRGTEDWSGSRMTISVGAARGDLVAEADAIFWRSMVSFGIVFAISLATALLMGEFGIRRRAAALTRASVRIASGDFATRTGVRPSPDEIGQLAASFDTMAGALQSTTAHLRMLSEAGKSLVRATDEASLLRDTCRVLVEHGGYQACWVDRDTGPGPNGVAVRTGAPVAVRDVRADALDPEWQALALSRGYGSFAALPIHAGGDVFGALNVSSREPRRFDDAEVGRLMELADDLGFGIQALRDREALDRHAQQLGILVDERTAELQAANRFLDSVIENIPDMIFVKRARDLRFVRFNRAGEALLGLARDELVGKCDHDLFPASQADFFVARDREVLSGGAMAEILEEPIESPAGTRLLHTKKIPVPGDDGRPAYLLGISRDITEQRSREREILALNATLAKRAAQLDAANRELEAFSYSVSHDLRAPLRHVQGYVELLSAAAGTELPEKARHYLSVIGESAHEMGVLIDDLLMFSRTSRTEMRMVPVELAAVVADSIRSLELQTQGRRIEWRVGPLPRVLGDASLLRQVLANLLGNAVKYTRGRDPAVIEIGAACAPSAPPVIHVRDNGVGFDMAHAAKLFGVFQRLHRADEFEGTGIGLAIAQRIVSRHGGRVWAQAERERGATFFFTLMPAPAGAGESPTEVP
jgi:PAS domain S-box-containing protein